MQTARGPLLRATLLLALAVAACVPGRPTSVVVHSSVSVVILPSPDALPFDPADARLAAATEQLAAIARHPVVFEFDVALLPDWRSSFQQVLIESVESVARDLDVLAREEPRVLAHGAPLLERVVSRYDAIAASEPVGKLDPAARVLTLTGPASFSGVERGYVQAALEDEYARWVAERWATARPQEIAAADRDAYFEFLTDGRLRTGLANRLPKNGDAAPRLPDPDA